MGLKKKGFLAEYAEEAETAESCPWRSRAPISSLTDT
jgi:hypothetical protein